VFDILWAYEDDGFCRAKVHDVEFALQIQSHGVGSSHLWGVGGWEAGEEFHQRGREEVAVHGRKDSEAGRLRLRLQLSLSSSIPVNCWSTRRRNHEVNAATCCCLHVSVPKHVHAFAIHGLLSSAQSEVGFWRYRSPYEAPDGHKTLFVAVGKISGSLAITRAWPPQRLVDMGL
ncbi:hypothetical protein BHM03_00037242, partial [Ensete ventricosum]